jgi:ubiquinone/menaquinone biosynthesis C-methylase UbiE
MSNDTKSIHEFELELISQYYAAVERQGPGSPEITKKALSFIEKLSEASEIVDLGCGTGGQTMVLGQNTKGNIRGYDLFSRFIDIFNTNAEKFGLKERVKGIVGSMDQLPFQKGEIDLIWSEGAIYNIGFERGLKEWKPYLKNGGYIAVSEVSWFTQERPKEIENFWMREYPEIDTIPHKVAQMQKAGYVPVATFILPENCWIEHFYEPQIPAQKAFLEENAHHQMAIDFIEMQRQEEQLYMKYKEYYGYVFFIGKKI